MSNKNQQGSDDHKGWGRGNDVAGGAEWDAAIKEMTDAEEKQRRINAKRFGPGYDPLNDPGTTRSFVCPECNANEVNTGGEICDSCRVAFHDPDY